MTRHGWFQAAAVLSMLSSESGLLMCGIAPLVRRLATKIPEECRWLPHAQLVDDGARSWWTTMPSWRRQRWTATASPLIHHGGGVAVPARAAGAPQAASLPSHPTAASGSLAMATVVTRGSEPARHHRLLARPSFFRLMAGLGGPESARSSVYLLQRCYSSWATAGKEGRKSTKAW